VYLLLLPQEELLMEQNQSQNSLEKTDNPWDGLPSTESKDSKFGTFALNPVTKKMERVGDVVKPFHLYPMPLDEYLKRKHHVGKGSWKRPESKDKENRGYTGEDYGQCGCKSGKGLFHPISKETKKCLYCGHTAEEIEMIQEEDK
jgi:hypothetical protein